MIWSVNDKISQQRDLQRSTFFRDKSEGWKDYVLFELLNILSSAIGSLTNPSKLSVTLKSVKTVKWLLKKWASYGTIHQLCWSGMEDILWNWESEFHVTSSESLIYTESVDKYWVWHKLQKCLKVVKRAHFEQKCVGNVREMSRKIYRFLIIYTGRCYE